MSFQKDLISHSNIVKCHESFEADDHYWMVMDYAAMNTLLTYRRNFINFGEPLTGFYMRQVCDALVYLHSNKIGIVHRDIKADNVLLFSRDVAKLSDFGWSCQISAQC